MATPVKRVKMEQIITPPLMLKYAWLTKPDETYKKYSVNIIGKREEDAAFDSFLSALEIKANHLITEMLKEQDPKKREFLEKNYKKTMPFSPEMEKYELTGFLVMKARSNAEHKPKVFCTVDGKITPTEKQVYSGSIGEVKCLLNPYISDSQKTYGCSLLLQAVNVIKFGTGNTGNGLTSGFSTGENVEETAPVAPPTGKGDF